MSTDPQNPEQFPKEKNVPISRSSKSSGENDLWNLDSDEELPVSPEAPTQSFSTQPTSPETPQPPTTETPVASKRSQKPTSYGDYLASLSKIEKIAISTVASFFIIAIALFIFNFFTQIEIKPLITKGPDLPIAGEVVTITSVETFWRKPNRSGDDPDIARRGVVLIPVLKINLEGSSGALRILFRNDKGIVSGDSITRSISTQTSMEIAATDGFAEIGMQAAYQTGDGDSWIVQVFEGPSVGAPIGEFNLLLETEISPVVR